jgi:hypothetical protein
MCLRCIQVYGLGGLTGHVRGAHQPSLGSPYMSVLSATGIVDQMEFSQDFITYLEQQTCPCIIVAVFRRVVSNRAIVARFALITLPCSMKPSDGPLQKLLGEQWA